MASYSELNDPMEGAFVITGDHRNIDNSWLEILRSEKNDLRICSLSRSFNNILMWAHYADSNNGCCIECEHYCPRKSFNISKSNKLIVTHQN